MPLNYINLASGYAAFLGGLGSVAITALTLVLALDRSKVDQRVFLYLPTTLVVGTLTSLIGAHLMVSLSGLSDPSGSGDPEGAARLFTLASVNTYLASGLFLFSLMLLPEVYDSEGLTAMARTVGFWSFLALQGASMVGLTTILQRTEVPGRMLATLVSVAVGVALGLVSAGSLGGGSPRAPIVPFILCAVASCLSVLWIALTAYTYPLLQPVDIWFVSLAVIGPSGSLMGLAVRIRRQGK